MPAASPRVAACVSAAVLMIIASAAPTAAAVAAVTEETACVAEVEPNDTHAQPVAFGDVRCVSGTLVEAGDTDAFEWQVDEADAASWSLALAGVPQSVTAVDLLRGDPETGELVVHLASSPELEEASADVELEAGTYTILVRREEPAGDGELGAQLEYELRVTPAEAEAVALASEPPVATTAPPEPARVVVVAEDGSAPTVGSAVALEMLLDTSGSMLERLAGKTKLEVAERALFDLVDALPGGMPVALRTFKAKARSCSTVLRVSLEPLRPAAMKQTIRELPIRKGTRTPLAKAIKQVPRDLREAQGHRVLVVVTDGKEDCGGDPAAAIRVLADADYTATVHLIGYALPDDDVLRSTLGEWAAIGGGRFIEAPDRASLAAALQTATTAPYLVFDEEGVLVAQGLVGDDGVELEAGVYRVEVLTDPPSTFEGVELAAGATRELGVETASIE